MNAELFEQALEHQRIALELQYFGELLTAKCMRVKRDIIWLLFDCWGTFPLRSTSAATLDVLHWRYCTGVVAPCGPRRWVRVSDTVGLRSEGGVVDGRQIWVADKISLDVFPAGFGEFTRVPAEHTTYTWDAHLV